MNLLAQKVLIALTLVLHGSDESPLECGLVSASNIFVLVVF